MSQKLPTVIDTFQIPEELAKELSELLTKQTVRERVLLQLINEPAKYEEAEKMILPIVAKIEAIKMKITKEYVPTEYNHPDYSWNYNGFEIAGNDVEILTIR